MGRRQARLRLSKATWGNIIATRYIDPVDGSKHEWLLVQDLL